MFACVCGFEAETEDELKSHFLQCHSISYGLDVCTPGEQTKADDKDRPADQGM
jgi:hypothetical protein